MSQQLNLFEPIEVQTKPPDGNQKMVDYGILNDESDFRAHVGYKSQHVLIFSTKIVKDVLKKNIGQLRFVEGSQRGVEVPTFQGYLVPISLIDGIQSILIPIDIYQKYPITKDGEETTTKGLKAVLIVRDMLLRQLVRLPINVSIINDKDLQIVNSTDIIVHSHLRIQVKCDYLAGEKQYGGTGNIFLQTAECNPRRMT